MALPLEVHLPDAVEKKVLGLPKAERAKFSSRAGMAARFGRELKYPYASILRGSIHGEMWELRFRVGNGVWRVAYKFDDANRRVVLLAIGNKRGKNQRRFYKSLIAEADAEYSLYLEGL